VPLLAPHVDAAGWTEDGVSGATRDSRAANRRLAQPITVGAQTLTAGAVAFVFGLDVVALRARIVVVVHVLLDGVKRGHSRHNLTSFPGTARPYRNALVYESLR
jgi:hypothetical protein